MEIGRWINLGNCSEVSLKHLSAVLQLVVEQVMSGWMIQKICQQLAVSTLVLGVAMMEAGPAEVHVVPSSNEARTGIRIITEMAIGLMEETTMVDMMVDKMVTEIRGSLNVSFVRAGTYQIGVEVLQMSMLGTIS